MVLPESVKVGGVTYKVNVTENLTMGIEHYSGECDFNKCEIRITPQSDEKMQRDFMHELIHAIAFHMGYTKHHEKKIDSLAAALYMVAKDNPGIFDFDMNDKSAPESECNGSCKNGCGCHHG